MQSGRQCYQPAKRGESVRAVAAAENAIAETDECVDALQRFLATRDHSVSDIYEHLVIADIRGAADVMRPVYELTASRDGYVSLECSPYLA